MKMKPKTIERLRSERQEMVKVDRMGVQVDREAAVRDAQNSLEDMSYAQMWFFAVQSARVGRDKSVRETALETPLVSDLVKHLEETRPVRIVSLDEYWEMFANEMAALEREFFRNE